LQLGHCTRAWAACFSIVKADTLLDIEYNVALCRADKPLWYEY